MKELEKLKKEVIISLKELIQTGVSKTKIETDLGMPKNCLSSIITGKKELSNKWVDRLIEYCSNYFAEKPSFIEGIWYTLNEGKIIEVSPEMIKEKYSQLFPPTLPSPDSKTTRIRVQNLTEPTPQKTNYSIDTTKKLEGYNAMNNDRFKKKMGIN